jgi:hypothetical protein
MPTLIGHNRGPKWQPFVDQLKTILNTVAPGEIASFATMSHTLGRKITSNDYALQAARSELLRTQGIVFDSIRGIGYQRVDDATKVNGVKHGIRKMHRAAKRTLTRNRAADQSKLSAQVRVTQLQQDAFLVTIARITHGKSIKARAGKPPSAIADYFTALAAGLRKNG